MRKVLLLCLGLAGALPGPAATQPANADYVLGPQDRLMIRVHTLRKAAGDAYGWEALTGEFSIGASGRLSIPILGEVDAAGVSTAALAGRISKLLQSTAGLTDLPSTSIEVVRYRPFFVIGAVQQPGRYEFQPGLTVLQALGTAQGLFRTENLSAAQTQAVNVGGDVRALVVERAGLQARLARLDAETADADAIRYPKELTDMSDDPRVADLMREETSRFRMRRDTLTAETAAVGRAKSLLEGELTALRSKATTLVRQEELAAAELRVVTTMVQKGIAVAPRQAAAESTRNMVQVNQQDIQVSILRAQQELARADRDLLELPARYKREAIDDTVASRAALAQAEEKLVTARRLQRLTENVSFDAGERTLLAPTFTLTRETKDGSATTDAKAADHLQPGDVLTVILAPSHDDEHAGSMRRTANGE